MKIIAALAVTLLMLSSALAAAADVRTYDQLLAAYVVQSPDGINRVNYRTWKSSAADRAALDQFIAGQQAVAPSTLPAAEQFVYWANLYNAVTLKVILDHYPVASIRDIKSEGEWLNPKAYSGPWVEKRVKVEGRELSLDDIENTMLRARFKDARVHYAVNCASLGCPNLQPRAWHPATLEADLNAAASAYINHPRGAALGDDGTLTVSSIYHWFKDDFGGSDEGVIAHFKKFAAPGLAKRLGADVRIGANRYDWNINDAR